jgi:hypothetical protein
LFGCDGWVPYCFALFYLFYPFCCVVVSAVPFYLIGDFPHLIIFDIFLPPAYYTNHLKELPLTTTIFIALRMGCTSLGSYCSSSLAKESSVIQVFGVTLVIIILSMDGIMMMAEPWFLNFCLYISVYLMEGTN